MFHGVCHTLTTRLRPIALFDTPYFVSFARSEPIQKLVSGHMPNATVCPVVALHNVTLSNRLSNVVCPSKLLRAHLLRANQETGIARERDAEGKRRVAAVSRNVVG